MKKPSLGKESPLIQQVATIFTSCFVQVTKVEKTNVTLPCTMNKSSPSLSLQNSSRFSKHSHDSHYFCDRCLLSSEGFFRLHMNEDITAKQMEYLTSLFGFGKQSDGSHPVMNSDDKQEEAYAQNMSQLSSFCSSEDYSDVDILSFFATSGTPVGE